MKRRSLIVFLLASLSAVSGFAQDVPKADVFAGYSFARGDLSGSGLNDTSLNGWNASVAANLNRWFSAVADFSGHYGSQSIVIPLSIAPCPPNCGAIDIDTKAHSFLFGPRVSYRTDRFTPFAHALFGASHVSETITNPLSLIPALSVSFSETGFAVAYGGGADVRLTRRTAWRGQADYLRTSLFGASQNNVRVSTGIVFRF